MKQDRQKSELEIAVEMLAAQGINTNHGVFSLVKQDEFDPKSNRFINVWKIQKETEDSIVYFPYQKGGEPNGIR